MCMFMPCAADRGGPAFVKDGQGKHVLVGMFITGNTACGEGGQILRLDTPETMRFLEDHMGPMAASMSQAG